MTRALMEREAPLARLCDAQRAGGRLVFVGGEAGVGKTTLVRAFALGLDGPVLAGACEHLATPAPLGPIADVAPGLGGALAADFDGECHHPRDVAHWLLEELRLPTVLVIEDVHWADEATLDVLRIVGRRIADTPSLVVVTYRND